MRTQIKPDAITTAARMKNKLAINYLLDFLALKLPLRFTLVDALLTICLTFRVAGSKFSERGFGRGGGNEVMCSRNWATLAVK